jgi:hypothetical protein
MKKVFFKFCTVIALTAVASGTFANDDSLYSVHVSRSAENKKVVLNLTDMMAYQVQCQIIDHLGRIIHTDKIRTDDVAQMKYDLNELAIGEYTFIINDLMKVERFKIKVTQEGVDFENPVAEIMYKPVVWLNADKKADFNLLALNNDVKVELISDEGILLSESFENRNVINKRYDLSHLDAGEYTMKVFIKDEVFYRYLSI